LEAQHQKTFDAKFQTKMGVQGSFIQNQNQAGTGISPLIPDYWGVMGAGFAMLEKHWQKLDIEFGTRYELKQFGGRSRGQTFAHTFHNYAVGLGLKYPIFPMLSFTYEGGYAQRAPEINELYSFGLHQGVSGIEEGNRNLSPERAFKNTATFQLQTPNNRFRAEVGGFYQHFLNYIYLQPQPDFRLTIRGAFPVFKYEQTQAQILGTYLNISYLAHKNIQISGKYSLTRGQDLQQNIPLVAIPTDNWSAYLDVFLPNFSIFEKSYVKLNGQFVRNQTRLLANQDFLSPPPAYYLAGFRVGTSVVFGKTRLNFSLEAQNLLNQKYRDYLNRQRYFADEMGRNFVLRTNFIFG
jgi:iron complex outermembrane receptor protein